MYGLVLLLILIPFALILIPFAGAVGKGSDDGLDACRKGQSELVKKVSDYHGEGRIKRLIEADLTRAGKEEAEGDADECLEALDHADKLIAGKY